MYCLQPVLKKRHLNVWSLFVNACVILCKPHIHEKELDQTQSLLKLYCKKFEELYGSKYCTPNMHLMRHIKEYVEDFGPVYAFWCFSFERFVYINTLSGLNFV